LSRNQGRSDWDGTVEEWDQTSVIVDFDKDGLAKKVSNVKLDILDDQATLEVRRLRTELGTVKGMLKKMLNEKGKVRKRK
jgi:hypothetical protein